MPKRKIKEEKPRKRFGKKELLIAPIAIGASMLVTFVIIPTVAPPPHPTMVCLKAENTETFQLFPRVQIFVDGHQKWLPDNVGKLPSNGKPCVRPIRTDQVGDVVHVEYIRPIRLTLEDFMQVYTNGTNMITVVDNSTAANSSNPNSTAARLETLNLTNYNIQYSYYSDQGNGQGAFVNVTKASDTPPFPSDNKIVDRIELTSKSSTNK